MIQLGAFTLNAQQKTASTALYSKIDNYLTAGAKNGFSGAISVLKNGEIIIQGNVREKVMEILQKEGFHYKRDGG